MATVYHNLSDYDRSTLPEPEVLARQRYAIVVAEWNSDITFPMLEGAKKMLLDAGVDESNIIVSYVPGTVELTYGAAEYLNEVNAVIVIGCVIKGDTPHFDYVCQSVTQGITILNTKDIAPVIFSVLTVLDKQQAIDRAGGKLGNKGTEGAYTAIRMANL
ncbi:MAG: 6,7-dimethyl-8-ribityllumazine synthase [Paludibacteraceae bacterium]|nr:6,7-dimethyl-8-ribityllumazine synthase [Paludibacteraceae bacterium]